MLKVDSATRWSLGLWFVFGFVPLIGQSMGWRALVDHQGLAAWVQAGGSILALMASYHLARASNEASRDLFEAQERMATKRAINSAYYHLKAADSVIAPGTLDDGRSSKIPYDIAQLVMIESRILQAPIPPLLGIGTSAFVQAITSLSRCRMAMQEYQTAVGHEERWAAKREYLGSLKIFQDQCAVFVRCVLKDVER